MLSPYLLIFNCSRLSEDITALIKSSDTMQLFNYIAMESDMAQVIIKKNNLDENNCYLVLVTAENIYQNGQACLYALSKTGKNKTLLAILNHLPKTVNEFACRHILPWLHKTPPKRSVLVNKSVEYIHTTKHSNTGRVNSINNS
jgi:predicted DCC family thiol-disulfide oxidoreductase YuxK